jgi:poly(hydroxyalkanoate) depolymerase family esterase
MSLVLTIANAWRPSSSRLKKAAEFGTNPGALTMLRYLPENLRNKPALVVVLHGSGQSAASYDRGAGWSRLADEYGFALLMPEQNRHNNLIGSFNWFEPNDMRRGKGEAHSILQMVQHMMREHDVDPRQVFICGLSAGGAMTLVMLSNYPEVFAAGAVIAGLPYGGAINTQEALRGMLQASPKSPRDLGDLVRGASPTTTVWPKLSVWHGSADRTVKPSNAGEIIKQWLDVHGLPTAPMSEQIIDGHPREVWWNAEGETVVESYTIAEMGHGTSLSELEGGIAGPYMIEAGISSSHHIARFFGLTDAPLNPPSRPNNRLVSLLVLRRTMRRARILAIQAWRNVRANIANMFAVGFGKSRSSKTN